MRSNTSQNARFVVFVTPIGRLLTALLIGLSGCSAPTPNAADEPDRHLGDLRRALAVSPDHLRARADEAVATRSADVIARFVREHVGVLVPLAGEYPSVSLRLGARGALRAGVGTFRDRAELLASLLEEAGFHTRVMTASRVGWADEVFRRPAAEFRPDTAIMAAVGAAEGVTVPSTFTADDAPGRVDAAVAQMMAALPPGSRAATSTVGSLPSDFPIVELTTPAGVTRWAIALGSTDVTDTAPAGLSTAGPVTRPSVRVSVEVLLAPPSQSVLDADEVHEVVAGDWSIDDVVGRSVTLTFAPPVPTRFAVGRDLRGYPLRIPSLQLQSLEALPRTVTAGFGGNPITLAGGFYEPSADNPDTLVGPYGPEPARLDESARAAARARAVTLSANVRAGTFPDIDLDVAVLDTMGGVVEGLSAEDFVVDEGGIAMSPSLLGNATPAAVRILVLYDTSGSVTESWGTAQARADFEHALAGALVSAAARTPYVVQVVGLGSSAGATWEAPNASSIESALASTVSNSDVWAAVGSVVPRSGASAAILVSDCVSSLELPEDVTRFQLALRTAGVPIAVVPIGTPDATALGTIVSGSGGVQLDPSDPAVGTAMTEFVQRAVTRRASSAYRLRYRAPVDGPAIRDVTVSIVEHASVAGNATYDVPAPADRAPASGVAGVYVTVTVGGVTDRRRLAGVELSYTGRPMRPPTAADLAEAMGVINGITDVTFEAPGATDAQRLDDVAAALGTLHDLRRAGPDDVAALEAGAFAARRLPWLGAALAERVGGADGVTPSGLEVRIFSHRSVDTGIDVRSDVVPAFSTTFGTSSDATEAFAAAMRSSVGASIRESDWMRSSAAGSLAGETLVVSPTSDGLSSWSAETKAAFRPLLTRYDSYTRLVPSSGAVIAMWIVDPATGSATAISADQAGGGQSCSFTAPIPTDLLSFIGSALTLISLYCTATGPGSEAAAAVTTSPYFCVRANVYGVGVLAYGSFSNPVNAIAGVLGTAYGFAPTIPSVAGKAVSIFLQLMLFGFSTFECHHIP